MSRLPALLLTCLALSAAGCGGDDDEETAATPTATPEDTGGEQGSGCEPAGEPKRKDPSLAKPKQKLDPSRTYVATVATNCGEFEITLDAKRAPRTGGSFKYLADEGFYDGLGFHRIVPGFVIQGGDPKGTGAGGPGYAIVEAPPADLTYDKGVAAMAKTAIEEPGTSGSQFFVVTADGVALEPDYALVGEVSAGMDVVELIGVSPVGPDEQQVEPLVMSSVMVAER
jgi:peptidyl-prolyl cis-trans isomerase B (cyclophilin B)